MMFWAWAGVPLGVYNIVSSFSIALQIQPQILAVLSLITWTQCYYYEHKWTITGTLTVTLPIACSMAGIEAGLIFALRHSLRHAIDWPVTLMAILAALFLALGVLRHYWDIYRYRTVRGISFFFVALDAMGDLTSLFSVLFLPKLDVLGLVIYGTEFVLWLGVFASGGYYNLLPWVLLKMRQRKARQDSGSRRSSEEQGTRTADIALHGSSSSSSVFRTPSAEAGAASARAHAAGGAPQP
jgi:hypothetical protein